jgi:hypothetical protein
MKHFTYLLALMLLFSRCNKPNLFDHKNDVKQLDGQWVAYSYADSSNNVLAATNNIGTLNIFGVYMGGVLISNKGKNCKSSTWSQLDYSDIQHKPEIGTVIADLSKQTIAFSGLEFPISYKILQFSSKDIWLQAILSGCIIKIKKIS